MRDTLARSVQEAWGLDPPRPRCPTLAWPVPGDFNLMSRSCPVVCRTGRERDRKPVPSERGGPSPPRPAHGHVGVPSEVALPASGLTRKPAHTAPGRCPRQCCLSRQL